MLPRYHILLGAIFTLIIWYFAPNINLFYLALILFGAIFIDFDHYAYALFKTKKISLKKALNYHKELRKQEEEEHNKGVR